MIDLGKKYTYRNGEPARILCTDAPGDYPIRSIKASGTVLEHDDDGCLALGRFFDNHDLIECPPEPQPARWWEGFTYANGTVALMGDSFPQAGLKVYVREIQPTPTTESTPVSSSLSYPPPESEWPEKPDPGPGMVWERDLNEDGKGDAMVLVGWSAGGKARWSLTVHGWTNCSVVFRAVPAPDPMKVQRWDNWGPDNTMATKFNGEYVRYADHLAALKQAGKGES